MNRLNQHANPTEEGLGIEALRDHVGHQDSQQRIDDLLGRGGAMAIDLVDQRVAEGIVAHACDYAAV